ncbi:MAG: hypothetical protein M3256_11330 [Actinomycetota bacterium]|nr:hypothetical protein [Actinomycetota bacterium]
MAPARRIPTNQPPKPLNSGLVALDGLAVAPTPDLQSYVKAASEYVLNAKSMSASVRKKAQIALSAGLARAVRVELVQRIPKMRPHAGERTVAGALRSVRADVSESHELDGLRLALEIKPINLAVGRAIWNRFGDVRTFAVNIHLKFPFAVVGGLLAVPTWEWKPSSVRAGPEIDDPADDVDETDVAEELAAAEQQGVLVRVSTRHLIERAEERFVRARLRDIEADPAHLLEATGLIVYDPDTGALDPLLPKPGSGLRWDEFIARLTDVYSLRFED